MIEFYDRNGKRMSLAEWSKAFENPKYRVLASHNVGNLLVSTVWLGFDHDFMNLIRETPLPPQIFESMIFEVPDGGPVDWQGLEMRRYRTEREAMVGHTDLVHIANTIESLGEEMSADHCTYTWADHLLDADDQTHTCMRPTGHDKDAHLCSCGAMIHSAVDG